MQRGHDFAEGVEAELRASLPLATVFTHRAGGGPEVVRGHEARPRRAAAELTLTPLVCLHGFTDTWRTWELVLPAARAPPRRARADARRPRGRAAAERRGRPTRCSPTRSSARWTRPASRPRTSSATRSAATSRSSSPRAAARARSSRSRPPAAGRAGDDSFRETARVFAGDAGAGAAAAPHADAIAHAARAGAARPRYIIVELRAHPGRARRAPDPRRRRAAPRRGADRVRAREELDARRRRAITARCGSSGAPRTAAAVAVGRRALPRRVAAARGLGRARRRRPLPAARRAARDRAS